METYKRGTIVKDGIRYGFYPDGSLVRLYDHTDISHATEEEPADTFIRIRQATKDGYISLPLGGVCDLSYPHSKIRRARVQGEGLVTPAITCYGNALYRIELYEIPT